MKKQMHFAFFALACVGCVLLAAVLQGCAGSSYALPTGTQLKASGVLDANVDMKPIDKGRTLVVTRCTECHRQYWPKWYEPEEWPKMARNMGEKTSLTSSQIENLSAYLVAASEAAAASE